MTNTAYLMKPDTASGMGLNLESLPLNVNQGSFGREVLFYQGSVLVAFWAPYSIPCHKEALMLREIALKRPRSLKVVKVNCEVEKELTRKYRVHELPGHILFQNGKEWEEQAERKIVKKLRHGWIRTQAWKSLSEDLNHSSHETSRNNLREQEIR